MMSCRVSGAPIIIRAQWPSQLARALSEKRPFAALFTLSLKPICQPGGRVGDIQFCQARLLSLKGKSYNIVRPFSPLFALSLKGHGNEADFLIDPLHYFLSRSDYGFEFAEIFVIEKQLPDSASR
jgi:hypothetical protein